MKTASEITPKDATETVPAKDASEATPAKDAAETPVKDAAETSTSASAEPVAFFHIASFAGQSLHREPAVIALGGDEDAAGAQAAGVRRGNRLPL
mgnify:CR=1 FL=1